MKFFLINENPFKLLFGLIGGNFALDLDVERGFRINPKIPKYKYYKLCEILEIEYNPTNPFSLSAFFREFNFKIPKIAYKDQKAQAHQVARYYRNLEEADKIYFFGWRDNNAYGTNVSAKLLNRIKVWFKSLGILSGS